MTREKGLETILVLVLVSLILFLKFDTKWLLYLSMVLLVVSVISTKATIFVGKIWFSFSHYLGMVMNALIMFLIFYIILTPLSFFQKLARKNKILQKPDGETYFHQRNHIYTTKDIEKPW
ncbi:hypothetical protein [Flagellimonas crocea]|uniref:hypothetical protein n=1 Tax=Flagellimonas crocea TaxID=3067311 RepID=UPI00296E86FC|nr:hypothetical protein [Muricauda sp. DH64]